MYEGSRGDQSSEESIIGAVYDEVVVGLYGVVDANGDKYRSVNPNPSTQTSGLSFRSSHKDKRES